MSEPKDTVLEAIRAKNKSKERNDKALWYFIHRCLVLFTASVIITSSTVQIKNTCVIDCRRGGVLRRRAGF